MTRLASDNALSACLQGRFSSRFLCLAKHAGASLSGTYLLSAQTRLSETPDAALHKISFFTWNRIEIYINYKRKIIMSNDQFINQKYLQSYKKNCNLEEFYIIIKSSYTKVSHIKRLTNSPKFTILFVLKQIKNNSLVLKCKNNAVIIYKGCLLPKH